MKRWLIVFILVSTPALAQEMKPNKEPVPSPSDIRADRAQDLSDGQAPENRTPAPSDLSTDRPQANTTPSGDLRKPGIQDPRNASAGGTRPLPAPDAVEGNQQEPLKRY